MEAVLKELENFGCDMEKTRERFVNDDVLLISCINEMIKDPGFINLGKALKENNIEIAFNEAHTLKGVISNLGILPMQNIIENIVEPLRKGEREDLLPEYDSLMKKLEELKDIMDKYK